MKYKQRPLTMWLRGLSIGVWIGLAGLYPKALFPTGTIILIICWVVAGLYQKSCDMEEAQQKREEEKAKARDGFMRDRH